MKKVSRFIPLLLALLSVPLLPAQALARREGSRVDRRTREQAEQLRDDGAKALAAKDLETAKKLLYQSYERNPASETLYFLGLLAAAEGHAIEAQDLVRRFLREVSEGIDAEQQKEANRILSSAIPPFGELDVQGERGALLSVDGRLLGVLPLSQPITLAPGTHSVTLGQGSRKLDGPVEIRVGRTAQLRFDMRTGIAVVTLPPTVLLIEDYRLAPPPTQTVLALAVEQGIRGQQLAILSARAALARAPELGNCLATRSCQEQLLSRNEVDFALHLYLAPAANGVGVALQGQLLDGPTGDAIVAVTGALDLTKAEVAPATASALATKLIQEARSRPRGTLEVLSTPPGAEVVLPRGVIGKTPYLRPTFAGAYEITLQLQGYQPARAAVKVEPDKKETVQLLLNPIDGEGDAPKPSGRKFPLWRTITGWSAIGVGSLALTFGVIGLIGNSSDGKSIAGVVVGSAFTTGGILLLTLPFPRPASTTKK